MSEISHERILDSLFEGVYYVDQEKRITFWNKGAERITGYSRAEVLGLSCAQNILRHVDDEGRELCRSGCPLTATLRDGTPREANVYLHHKQGHRVPVSVRASPVRDADGRIVGSVEIFVDNSSYRQILRDFEELKHEVFVDELTQVGNRRYGEMILRTRLYEWQASQIPFGVLFVDIDGFKDVNDTHGHKRGDAVLVMVGRTIGNLLRQADHIVRWGGDEFIVILSPVNAGLLKRVAERIRVFVERSFIMMERDKLSVTASLGATAAEAGDTVDTILQRADGLMYFSKNSGRNRVTIG